MKKDDNKPKPLHPVAGALIVIASVLCTIGAYNIIKGLSMMH